MKDEKESYFLHNDMKLQLNIYVDSICSLHKVRPWENIIWVGKNKWSTHFAAGVNVSVSFPCDDLLCIT